MKKLLGAQPIPAAAAASNTDEPRVAHTPGPWFVISDPMLGDDRIIATHPDWALEGTAIGYVCIGDADCTTPEQRDANARLMASAPAMARIAAAAKALVADVRSRYPGEEFHCPYMRELARAIEAGTAETGTGSTEGNSPVALRVWWIPQIPMKAFFFRVPTIEAGAVLCEALAKYDLFQLRHNIKPDYANAGGLAWKHPEVTEDEWYDFDHEDDFELSEVQEAILTHGVEEGCGEEITPRWSA